MDAPPPNGGPVRRGWVAAAAHEQAVVQRLMHYPIGSESDTSRLSSKDLARAGTTSLSPKVKKHGCGRKLTPATAPPRVEASGGGGHGRSTSTCIGLSRSVSRWKQEYRRHYREHFRERARY